MRASDMRVAEELDIEASNPIATNTGVEGAVDVDVDVGDLSGEVTMVRDEANGGWTSYGPDANYWIESNFLATLRERYGDASEAIISRISGLAAIACAAYRPE
jgi:hypothetical protein